MQLKSRALETAAPSIITQQIQETEWLKIRHGRGNWWSAYHVVSNGIKIKPKTPAGFIMWKYCTIHSIIKQKNIPSILLTLSTNIKQFTQEYINHFLQLSYIYIIVQKSSLGFLLGLFCVLEMLHAVLASQCPGSLQWRLPKHEGSVWLGESANIALETRLS